MREILITDTTPPISHDIRKWEKYPDSAIQTASEILHKQIQKPQKTFNIEHLDTDLKGGVHILPNWEGYRIEALGQRTGGKDLLPRGSSAHDVAFCTAEVRTPEGLTTDIPIAIKTFENYQHATHDALVNAVVLQRGMRTTNPLAIMIENGDHKNDSGKKRGFIITPARRDIQALDTEPWHQYNSGSIEVREYFEQRLKQISESLADLNAIGITHGDPQVKNFWASNTGEVEPFDWESAKIYPNPPSPLIIPEIASIDIETLYRSLTNQIGTSLIPAFTGPIKSQWEQFRKVILEPYEDRLLERLGGNEDSADQVIEAVGQIEHGLVTRFSVK